MKFLGSASVLAGLEHVNEAGHTSSSSFLGAEHDFGQVTAGTIAGNSDLIGTTITSMRAYATYSPNDRLDLTASVLSIDSAGPDGTLYGLSANYKLNETVFVEAGYLGTNGSGVGGDDIFAVGLGVTF